jgi:uncharacterized YigZ family protein
MNTPLSTLVHPATASEDIKKSRFLCQAAPATTPEAALAFLARVTDPQATHNCWAYRIGQHYRYADDGEPVGTAGKPMLQAIDGQGFDRVMVVVTRWYGGIKLGAGGLMRAYGGVTALCLRLAERAPIVETSDLTVELPFAQLAQFKARLPDFGAGCMTETFGSDGAALRLTVPTPQVDALAVWLADLTRGRATMLRTD